MENQEEQVTEEGQGTDRVFIILVAVLGGLLVLGFGAFVAWAVFIAPNMRANIEARNEAIFATNTAVAIAGAATETGAVTPTPTYTPSPTDTPIPTDTPTLAPATETLTPAPPTETSTPAPPTETATPEATATAVLTTPADQSGSADEGVPDTGVGILGGAALASGLVFLLAIVRHLRKTV